MAMVSSMCFWQKILGNAHHFFRDMTQISQISDSGVMEVDADPVASSFLLSV